MGKAIICNLGQSRSFGRLSLKAKVLWPMLLVACDDQGRGDAAPDVVKWYICPNVDEISQTDVPELLSEMEEQGMIHLYKDQVGESLFQIVKWWEYQSPQWAKRSKFKAPEGWIDRVRYNIRGSEYVQENWDSPGGFVDSRDTENPGHNPGGNPGGNQGGRTKEVEDKRKEVEVEVEEQGDLNAFALYEQATASTLTPIIVDHINDLIDECEDHRQKLSKEAAGADLSGEGWVKAGIREATECTNQFGIRYVAAILDRWRRDGFQSERNRDNGQGNYDDFDFGDRQ